MKEEEGKLALQDSEGASIIVPTYCRPQYLKGLLSYFRSQRVSWPIVVADSSRLPESEANKEISHALHADLNLRYLKFDPNIYGLSSQFSEIVEALKTVDSKYSLLCFDDDFVVPNAVRKCVDFLEANPEYVTAGGWYLTLYAAEVQIPHQVRWRTPEANIIRSKLWATRSTTPTIDDADPSVRFSKGAFSERRPICTVYRRREQIRNMELAAKNTSDFFFGDHILMCLPVIQGKLKFLDTLYLVKRFRTTHYYDAHIDPSVLPPHDLFVSNNFSQKYSAFRDCVARDLATATSFDVASKLVDQAFLRYLSYYLKHHFAHRKEHRKSVEGMLHLIKAMRIGLGAVTFAVLEHRFGDLLASPYEFALTSYSLRKRSLPLDTFLKRFSCHEDFEAIYPFLCW